MSRDMVYKDIEEMFGFVPTFLKSLPDATLELEWELWKKIEDSESAIPNKYKELIGVAVSAATKCQYCSLFHTEMAKLNGATDAEVEDAVHLAKNSAGWSAYLNGMQVDYATFKDEVKRAVEYNKAKEALKKAA